MSSLGLSDNGGRWQLPTAAGWRLLLTGLLVCLAVYPLFGMSSGNLAAKATKTPKNAAAGNAYDVIALVNQVRTSNGLSPFQPNGALMAAAQAHSQYQASIGSTTHTGSGGSDVKSRALASGYGGGTNVSVIENIYGGMGATPQRAVSWWQGDSLHLNTILSTRHTDVGAGIAISSSGVVYITLDVGSVGSGAAPPVSAATPGSAAVSAAPPAALAPAVAAISPLKIASPGSDGSVVHEVQPGQTLWTIAAAYKIDLSVLLQLNGLTSDSYIFPGDKVLIKPAGVSPDQSATETPQPADSPDPITQPASPESQIGTKTAVPSSTTIAAASPTASMVVNQSSASPSGLDPLLLIIVVLVFSGAALIVAGNVLKHDR